MLRIENVREALEAVSIIRTKCVGFYCFSGHVQRSSEGSKHHCCRRRCSNQNWHSWDEDTFESSLRIWSQSQVTIACNERGRREAIFGAWGYAETAWIREIVRIDNLKTFFQANFQGQSTIKSLNTLCLIYRPVFKLLLNVRDVTNALMFQGGVTTRTRQYSSLGTKQDWLAHRSLHLKEHDLSSDFTIWKVQCTVYTFILIHL